ncbi:PKD domain-containing protein, partial [Cerasicoccus arenae]
MAFSALIFSVPSARAVTYPATNYTNFPEGSYNDGNATELEYRYFVPVNYDANDSQTLYPLVLFLHGSTEKGDDNNKQLGSNANSSMIFVSSANPDNQTDFPCFWVAPQCQLDDWGDDYLPAQIQGLLDDLIANYHIDPDRIYITGLSLGANGLTTQLSLYPNRYAAANPNCGTASGMESVYAHVPLWAFHAADDGVQGVNGSDVIISGMRAAGGTPIYTRYNTGGHHAGWLGAYSPDTPLVPWMMSQRRGQEPVSIVGPHLKVTSPTSSGNISTSDSSVVLSGVADADTTHIWYRNNQFFNETPPTVSGTTSWSVTASPLRGDSVNPIYLEAETIATPVSANYGGKTTTNAHVIINHVTGDSTQPVVTITSPTSSATYATAATTVDIGGTVSDNVGVTSLSWSNNLGGSGSITIGATWQYNNIPLQSGANVITITALDAANNVGTDVITVTSSPTPANQSPTVNAGTDDSVTLISGTGALALSGSASDDGLPQGSSLTTQWTKFSGPGTVTFADDSQLATTATFTVEGTYVLRLTGSDTELSASDDVTITVSVPTNQSPVVNAGTDDYITLVSGTAALAISGSASDDGLPQGSSLTTQWTTFSGPGTATFADDSLLATTATFTVSGTYVLRLTGSDTELSASDDVTITVNPEGTPPPITYPTVNSTNFPSGSYDNGNATSLHYRYMIPENYDSNDAGTLYPLVLSLHRADERGTDNSSQLVNNANGSMIFISTANPDNREAFPCFWVAPQCQLNNWGDSYLPGQIQGMLDDLIANYHIDPDRIYITGMGMGGEGVVKQIDSYPSRYAAANPNAGSVPSSYADNYAHIPLWAFHCVDDATIGINGSDQIAGQMRAAGGKPIYTRYDTGGHSAAWTRAYGSQTPLVAWVMSQRRNQEPASLVGPYIKVTSPTTSGSTTVSGGSLPLSGVADADTTNIWYRNSQFFNEPTPAVNGTSSWNVTVTPLRLSTEGTINEIYLEAETIAYGAPGNGKTITNDFIDVNALSGGDVTLPVVSITSPASNGTYATTASTVTLAGSASDNVGVSSLSWANNQGGSGSITVGTSWQVNDIPLQTGDNVITITALDAASNVGTDVITVTSSSAPTNQSPVVNAGTDDSVALSGGTAALAISGSASDDGLPQGSSLTTQWTTFSGPGTVTFADDSLLATTATFTVEGTYVLRLTGSDTAL